MQFQSSLNVKQRGAALLTALAILLVLTIIGIAAMGASVLSERMASNDQLQTTTFYASHTGASSAVGQINIQGPWLAGGLYQSAMGLAVADAGMAGSFKNNVASLSICVDVNGAVTLNCNQANLFLDAATNLRTQANLIYKGCRGFPASPLYKLNQGPTGTLSIPHYLQINSSGWIESGDDNQVSGDEPRTNLLTVYQSANAPC